MRQDVSEDVLQCEFAQVPFFNEMEINVFLLFLLSDSLINVKNKLTD